MTQKKKGVKPIQIALTEDQIARIIQEAAKSRRSLSSESLEDRIAPSRFGLPVMGGGDIGGGGLPGTEPEPFNPNQTVSDDGTTMSSPQPPAPFVQDGAPPVPPPGGPTGPTGPTTGPDGDPTTTGVPQRAPLDPNLLQDAPPAGGDDASPFQGLAGPVSPDEIPNILRFGDFTQPEWNEQFDVFFNQQLTELEFERGEPIGEEEIEMHRENILRQLRDWQN
jgi:hypothetical protein